MLTAEVGGGQVEVSGGGSVATAGQHAIGIRAQSVGGGNACAGATGLWSGDVARWHRQGAA